MAKKRSGYDAVMKMHQDFLTLVSAYNAVGMFEEAANAQRMAIALNEFEERHIITNMAWPPRLVKLDEMRVIAPAHDEGHAGSLHGLHKDYQ